MVLRRWLDNWLCWCCSFYCRWILKRGRRASCSSETIIQVATICKCEVKVYTPMPQCQREAGNMIRCCPLAFLSFLFSQLWAQNWGKIILLWCKGKSVQVRAADREGRIVLLQRSRACRLLLLGLRRGGCAPTCKRNWAQWGGQRWDGSKYGHWVCQLCPPTPLLTHTLPPHTASEAGRNSSPLLKWSHNKMKVLGQTSIQLFHNA